MKVPYDATVRVALGSLERNLLPDAVIRRLTRLLLAARLRSGYKPSSDLQLSDLLRFVHCMSRFSIVSLTPIDFLFFFGGIRLSALRLKRSVCLLGSLFV